MKPITTKESQVRKHKLQQWLGIIPILMVATIGMIALTNTDAAPRNLEAESGTKTTNAAAIADPSASGQSAVRFSTTSESGSCSGAPNTPGGSDPWGNCWPGPDTTGIAGCPALTTHSGDYTVGDNETLENTLINGQLRIPGRNVTIRCVRVVDNNSYFPIDTDYSDRTTASEAILEHIEVSCNGSQIANAAMDLFYLTLRYARVYDCTDAYRIHDNVILENSYCGDLRVEGDEGNDWHYDCVQTIGGNNMVVRHNALVGKDTSDIALWPDITTIDTVVVERNLLLGTPGYKIYVGKDNGRTTTNVTVRENRFGPGGYGPCSVTNSSPVWTGNVWNDSGVIIPLSTCQ